MDRNSARSAPLEAAVQARQKATDSALGEDRSGCAAEANDVLVCTFLEGSASVLCDGFESSHLPISGCASGVSGAGDEATYNNLNSNEPNRTVGLRSKNREANPLGEVSGNSLCIHSRGRRLGPICHVDPLNDQVMCRRSATPPSPRRSAGVFDRDFTFCTRVIYVAPSCSRHDDC